MPLFGKKVFVCTKPLTNKDSNETVYTISHTKEQFRSKEYPLKISPVNFQHGRAHLESQAVYFVLTFKVASILCRRSVHRSERQFVI